MVLVVSDCLPLFPEEHMYLKINKFLLSHEYLNMSKVPGFFQFFFSSDFEVVLLKSSVPERLRNWVPWPLLSV